MSYSATIYRTIFNRPGNVAPGRAGQKLDLELRYTDEKHGIELCDKVLSPPTITIRKITEELLEFLCLDDISPENVRLAGVRDGVGYYRLTIKDTQKAIHELDVTDGCILYFEPTSTAPPPQPCRLTIVGPDEVKKVDYEWYRAKTTVIMLLEYVIEKFSLQSVDRERIHLLTIVDELDFWSKATLRLSECQLYNGMSVYIQIIPPLSPTTMNESKEVHVKCTYTNGECTLDVSNIETIGNLKDKIKEKVEGRKFIDFVLCNENNEELDLNDSDRALNSFGIKSGQTIFATFRLISRKAQPPVKNEETEASSSSSNTKSNYPEAIVICQLPSQKPESFRIPLTNTIYQLMKQIENLTVNQRLVVSRMYSESTEIDFKSKPSRCLADYGFKENDVINITMTDKSPVHSSIISTPSPSPTKSDTQPKPPRSKNMPIGLDNLKNSCYMNSALQCLAHVPQLTNTFLEGIRNAHMDDGENTDTDWNPYDQVGEVTGAYAELLWNLWKCDGTDNSYDSFKPTRIKEKMGNKDRRFARDDQQDAQEFMSFFLDVVHGELKAKNKNQRNTIIKQLFFGEMTSIITCMACNKEESTTHPISFLSIPLNRQERRFEINFISKKNSHNVYSVEVPISSRIEHVVDDFTQGCNRPSLFHYILVMVADGELDFRTPLSEVPTDELIFMEQEDPTKNIRPEPLKLPRKRSTLEDCLKEFFSREILEDGWNCQQRKCQKKTLATKQLKLCTPPSVLIIQFKRFSHENGLHLKVETFVEYPIKGLNLNECLPSLREEAIYDLVAVSNHLGSICGGHYVAYAQHSTANKNRWYRFDDSCVTLVKQQDYNYDIVSRDAYLLFYIRRDISNQTTTTV